MAARFAPRLIRPITTALLRISGWTLPRYFSERERLGFLLKGFEQSLLTALGRLISPGSRVLDIGANIGLVSRHCARLAGNSGLIAAFEPDPDTFACLRANTRKFPQIHTVNSAISDVTCAKELFLHPTSGMSNSLVHHWEGGQTVTVDTITVDGWLEKNPAFGCPDLVKIDVEGAEEAVLRGMQNTFVSCPNLVVVMEFCPKLLGGAGASLSLLSYLRNARGNILLIQESGAMREVLDEEDIFQSLNKDGFVNLVGFHHGTAPVLQY
jgi:FkbM family methyltransferase